MPVAIRSLQITGVQTSIQSPWQTGVAERWVGSCRRDLLDHIIAVNERHLNQLLSDYVRYYHEDRTQLGRGNARSQNPIYSNWPGDLPRAIGRFASSLRPRSLISPDCDWHTSNSNRVRSRGNQKEQ